MKHYSYMLLCITLLACHSKPQRDTKVDAIKCKPVASPNSFTQTKAELKTAKRLFEGSWVNKKAKRHLTISFDTDDYATINDWHGKWSQDNNTIDAYKAFVRVNKLVMPEDKTDLRAPNCELVKQGNTLLYRCRGMDTKDLRFVEEVLFVKEKD